MNFDFHSRQLKCCWQHPPADEIYRSQDLSVFEVDGQANKVGMVWVGGGGEGPKCCDCIEFDWVLGNVI